MWFLQSIGIKGVAVIILLIAIGGWAGLKHFELSKTRSELEAAITERDVAAEARDKAISAAKANEETIVALQQEKAKIQEALTSLAADKKKNQQTINTLMASIRSGSSNPANQVLLSPVLRTTVDSIQKDRAAREVQQ